MQHKRPSIWLHDSNETASGKPGTLHPELWALSNHDEFVLERVQDLYARARAPLMQVIREIRPDLSPQAVADLALFISASMEGLTIFAGNKKPFEPRMPQLETIAIQSFVETVRGYGQED